MKSIKPTLILEGLAIFWSILGETGKPRLSSCSPWRKNSTQTRRDCWWNTDHGRQGLLTSAACISMLHIMSRSFLSSTVVSAVVLVQAAIVVVDWLKWFDLKYSNGSLQALNSGFSVDSMETVLWKSCCIWDELLILSCNMAMLSFSVKWHTISVARIILTIDDLNSSWVIGHPYSRLLLSTFLK